MMKKIIVNIVDTWWETSDSSLRDSCRSHCKPMFRWRYVVSTHQYKGINTSFPISPKFRPNC